MVTAEIKSPEGDKKHWLLWGPLDGVRRCVSAPFVDHLMMFAVVFLAPCFICLLPQPGPLIKFRTTV